MRVAAFLGRAAADLTTTVRERRIFHHGFGNDVEDVLAGETSGYGKRLRRPQVRFAMNSPLEGDGFEPSVPRLR
jgi:hypothetical protein